ncbi:MAG TPA: RQC domain-containing protein, partial [Polyangiaceae bacterium]|nr:RQC domain-containing protein [Polyangiaceae bacterium]
ELLRWAEGGTCRHTAILRYFGTEHTPDDCGRCDVCTELASEDASDEEVTLLVRKALSAVARVHGKFGLTLAAKLLRGEKDERIEKSGLDRVPTFGVLRDKQQAWLVSLLRRCVTAGWVAFSGGDRPVLYLTHDGQHAMKGGRAIRLRLPPERRALPGRDGFGSSASDSSEGRERSGSRAGEQRAQLETSPADEPLFEALRAHRLALAREQGVAPYVIASDRSLRELCLLKPRNLAELLDVYGFGETRAERYGPGLIEVVRQFAK